MTRFLHTADWQLGLEARHVAQAGPAVRAARLETVRKLLQAAAGEGAEFVLVAGDCFEDNQVSDELVHRLLRLIDEAAPLPVLLLPGNHDCLGPNSVYRRKAFRQPPPNLRVLDSAQPLEVRPGVFVLPAPLRSRSGREDPTAQMAGPAAGLSGGLRLGVTHGALRLEGRYQVEDHPISLDAARRLSLDYLALGHWHSTFQLDARTAYAGAPEPTGFGERDSGNVLLVDIEAGHTPELRRLPVATLDWLMWEEHADAKRSLEEVIAECRRRCERLPRRDHTLLRLVLSGVQEPGSLALLRDFEAWLGANLLFAEVDATALRVPADGGRLSLLRKGHPLLDGLAAALAEPEVSLEGLGLPPADRSPEVLSEAAVLFEELVEEIWS